MDKTFNKTTKTSIWHYHRNNPLAQMKDQIGPNNENLSKIDSSHPYFQETRKILEMYGSFKKEKPNKQLMSGLDRTCGDRSYHRSIRGQWNGGERIKGLIEDRNSQPLPEIEVSEESLEESLEDLVCNACKKVRPEEDFESEYIEIQDEKVQTSEKRKEECNQTEENIVFIPVEVAPAGLIPTQVQKSKRQIQRIDPSSAEQQDRDLEDSVKKN